MDLNAVRNSQNELRASRQSNIELNKLNQQYRKKLNKGTEGTENRTGTDRANKGIGNR